MRRGSRKGRANVDMCVIMSHPRSLQALDGPQSCPIDQIASSVSWIVGTPQNAPSADCSKMELYKNTTSH
jgi:hypothetical protein